MYCCIIIQLNNMENEDNVLYCKSCLSLKILDAGGEDYCGECSSASIEETSIEEWENLYFLKYNKPFLNKRKK